MLNNSFSDLNECDSVPCRNGGTCTNTPGSYMCDCGLIGFEGPTCEDGKVYTTGYKLVCQFSLPTETVTVRHTCIWFSPRLSAISFFMPRLLSRQEADSNGQTRQEAI